ncbi:MAG TPA: hypothetical protein VGD33_08110 [Chitinophagaceae bacterium]
MRQFISLVLFCAFMLMQGHNFIPHHHHTDAHHHSDTGHHEHEDESKSDKDLPFHTSHQPDFGKVLVKAGHLKELLVKPPIFALITEDIGIDRSSESPPLIRPPAVDQLKTFLFSYSVPLRAPPAPPC